MNTILDWRDMSRYGIEVLTGESCAFGLRLLCDLNIDGFELLREFFGLFGTAPVKGSNWNPEVNGKRAICSIMLPKDMLRSLAAYVLFRQGYEAIHDAGFGPVYGLTTTDIASLTQEQQATIRRNPAYNSNIPMKDGRCIHQATGRSE